MWSLRTFHLGFILVAFVLTDLFGAWAVHEHSRTHETATLIWGLLSFAAGFGLVGYALLVVRKFERSKLD
jgi:hypothetical protein